MMGGVQWVERQRLLPLERGLLSSSLATRLTAKQDSMDYHHFNISCSTQGRAFWLIVKLTSVQGHVVQKEKNYVILIMFPKMHPALLPN